MKNSINGKERSEIKIVEVNSEKFVFKTTYSWAFCLNANQEEKVRYYSLPVNFLNYQKLQKIVPNFDFSSVISNPLPTSASLKQLRTYQQEDVNFLSRLKSVAIFSEMRTGKTPTALMTFKRWPVSNLLIIAPSILQQHWQRLVEEWLVEPAYVITYLDKEQRHGFYHRFLCELGWVIIVSKDTFKIDSAYFKKIKKKKGNHNNYCVIVDEAHFLRSRRPQSQQSKSIYVLQDAPFKMVLTGTPVVNHHDDIFGILKFLKPEIYSSYWKFAEQYFYIQKLDFRRGKKSYKIWQVKDFKNRQLRQELHQQITQFSVNRRQKEVLPWLPPVIYQKEYLLLEEEQQKIYSQWKEKWKEYQPLEVLAKLKTLTLYPPVLGFSGPGSKINYLISFFQEQKEQGVIIFSTRSETFLEPLFYMLKERGIEAGLVIGKTGYREKEWFISQFQNGELNILLCNIQSAGVGLNLSRAETVIFADRSYSPADNEQAEARFLSTTESELPRVRLIIDLICKGTIDEKILKLLRKKEDITKFLNTNPSYFFG